MLDGSAGNDRLFAGNGATDLIGGPNDILKGNTGADTYVFMGDFGNDEITNYNSAKDVIQLDASDFAKSRSFSDWSEHRYSGRQPWHDNIGWRPTFQCAF